MTGCPVVQVRGSSLLLYDEPVRLYSTAKSLRRQLHMKELAKKKAAYSGGMTQGTRKRLAKAVTIMSQAIKPTWKYNPVDKKLHYHKFAFITLTVANDRNITAREAYDSLLSHFLDWMTRTEAIDNPAAKTYIWKAELQTRGQIHYHITTPAFIDYRDIRKKWNELQRKAGLLDDYAKEHGHFDPNGTDIHETKMVKKVDRYLLKELNKSMAAVQFQAMGEVYELIESGQANPEDMADVIAKIRNTIVTTTGRVWGCSEDLAGVNYFTLAVTRDHEWQIDQWIKEGKARKVVDDYFVIVYCDDVDPPDLLNRKENIDFEKYLKRSMDRTRQQEMAELSIPAACVQMDQVDVAQAYTIEQLQLNFN